MQRLILYISGIVQGVGFRPFVHRLVSDCGLCGCIKNSSSGVELELEGEKEALDRFLYELPRKAPILSVIEHIDAEFTSELKNFQGFEILSSETQSHMNTLISPDIATCPDCLRELDDPANRRYRYPFINCTNCGPRFTIIKDIPYDRPRTSMSRFPMCPDCEKEYRDIENRRYHAQPDCCERCGPQLLFFDADAHPIPGDGIELARQYLKDNKILAVKGLGGVHLACLPEETTVCELRRRKQRDEKPFALMCRDIECVKAVCHVSEQEAEILQSFRRPIVLLRKKSDAFSWVSENNYLGIMLPYTPLHHLLFSDDIDMLVMTSANLSDTPMLYRNAQALNGLRGIADAFLLNDREILTRCDDSLCWVMDGHEYFARRSRGYVPYPVTADRELLGILACGAEQKASFCLSKGRYVFPSQHIGDLKNYETLESYSEQIAHFEKLFDIKPTALVCDLHPDYLSTDYAANRADRDNLRLIKVQHHHAHMASCLADNGYTGKAIGLIWDGTGLGTDGTVWGSECLIGDYSGFVRFGSILPIPLIGGDRVSKEIDRTAFALLHEAGLDTSRIESSAVYEMLLNAKMNCPPSSGMGRLFDGVAYILGIKKRCSYEGQAAMLLEAAAIDDGRHFPVEFEGSPLRFDWREMIRRIVSEAEAGVGIGLISGRFMNTLIEMAVRICLKAREYSGIETVALSGGSFQNMYIMSRLPERLEREGFRVLCHRRVSANDEGLSLGQLMIADSILKPESEKNVSCSTL